ncbi:PIN domain nuclease [Spirosoma sp. BT702]|uniref:PIN domain nuclease n=1 Tax=Spirosoma profusum TaxID=2771354 RepID=A0A927AR54_9BACT|nr:PIN domain nuclease [Spirosoma profusum]MBD2701741.1 PIN domain nuclease [Spirosoma profusum]
MEPTLIDTSVWIDYIRQQDTTQVRLLKKYLYYSDLNIYVTSTIIQEVLQGVHEDSLFNQVKKNLLSLAFLKLDLVEAAIGAAELYRVLRKKGVTIRKPNDCLIAHYAIFYDMPILHRDADFDHIARFSALRIAKE